MTDSNPPDHIDADASDQLELAHRQALQYGRDLARLFKEEQAKRRELEILNETLETVFESVPQGMAIIDRNLTIGRYNTAFERLLKGSQTRPGDWVGRPIHEALPDQKLSDLLHRMIVWPETRGQTELTLPGEPPRACSVLVAPLKSLSTPKWVVVLNDRSFAKRIERQKADFINLIAREFSAPIDKILEQTELAERALESATETAAAAFGEHMQPIHIQGQRLRQVVTQLLRFSEMGQGQFQPDQFVEVDLERLIREIAHELHPHADERLVTLQLYLPEPLPAVRTNPAVLSTALNQLLINGLEVMYAGGVLSIAALPDYEGVVIQVSDTGPQISPEVQDIIFDLGGAGNDAPGAPGLRLGLPMARHAVSALGGTLALESSSASGTTFVIRLPAKLIDSTDRMEQLYRNLEAEHKQSMLYARDLKQIYARLKATNSELALANDQLTEANQLKANFLGLVSHELKSPIALQETALYLFKRAGIDHLNPDQKDLFEQILHNHAETAALVNQLVKYAGLLSKQGRLNLAGADLVEIFGRIHAASATLAESRGIRIEMDIPPRLWVDRVDAKLVEESLWQLVQNSLKATPPGGRIILHGSIQDEVVVLQVQDTGRGIPPERQKSLWEAFAQSADFLRRGKEGLGLGLALVRYVATAHHGQVTLQSEPGVGSLIGFWLPLRVPALEE